METIQLIQPQQEFTDFMAMPDGIAKNITYYTNFHSRAFNEASITRKNECTYYAANTFKIVKSTKSSYYIKRVTKDGFTIDEKGKVSFWFNKSIFQMPHLSQIFKHFNFNWLDVKLHPFITKGIFEKMIAGKITNSTDVCKAYIKAMRLNCSPALFLQLFQANSISKQDFLRRAAVAKDINHFIEYLLTPNDNRSNLVFEDMVKEAQMLERKIDYKWSSKRLIEEHKAWTQEIMEIEVNSLEDITVASLDKFDRYTPEQFKLLKTQKEVFAEGKNMHHCVYTAYWTSIKQGNYLAYHITLGEEEATLGINIYGDKLSYNQCYSRYNGSISAKLHSKVKTFVEELIEQVQRDGILKESVYEYIEPNIIINELPF